MLKNVLNLSLYLKREIAKKGERERKESTYDTI